MNEKIKSAILGAQATTTRWEVLHSTTVLLNLPSLDNLGNLPKLVQALGNCQVAWQYASCDPAIAEGYECAMHSILQDIADECVRLVLGDDVAEAAKDAADLAAAKKLARKLGVAHTFCV